ncbi:MAG: glycosyltransferase [Candidatus Aegiribacteria sp.]|nr:glycosyltransferase [Candidatus Aegiribacteria sp.]MBD3295122.1 glycosyltransferase [Candidatus Fermentibacteria bacterium]
MNWAIFPQITKQFHKGERIEHHPENSLSVILPAFNEAENVRYMVNSASEVLDCITEQWEVIVVDDGSTDETASETLKIAQFDERVRLVSHPENIGIGRAVWTGIRNSRMKWIFYTDCDGQFDLKELELLWRERHLSDVLSGYRRNRQDPLMRLMYSFAYNTLTYLIFWKGFKDVDSSFKLFRRKIFSDFEIRSTSSVADLELLLLPRLLGYRVKQMPVSHYPRRAGTVSCESYRRGIFAWVRLGPIFEMFVQLLDLRLRIWRGDAR